MKLFKTAAIIISMLAVMVIVLSEDAYGYTVKGLVNYFTYLDDDGEVTIMGYYGPENAVMPSEIDGMPVTAIYDYAFYRNKDITTMEIPDSVQYIGKGAFSECTYLTSVKIPDGVTSIEK